MDYPASQVTLGAEVAAGDEQYRCSFELEASPNTEGTYHRTLAAYAKSGASAKPVMVFPEDEDTLSCLGFATTFEIEGARVDCVEKLVHADTPEQARTLLDQLNFAWIDPEDA
jgi:hypothetical protein